MDGEPRPNVWAKFLFQRIFIFSLFRLVIYLNKIYHDFGAVQLYYEENARYPMFISLVSLLIPSINYAIYLAFQFIMKSDLTTERCQSVFTKFVQGLLLIPWQIKRHLDSLYFGSQLLCSFRAPNKDEKNTYSLLIKDAETLEFFEDFYAGFLQLIFQLFILSSQLNQKMDEHSLLRGELFASVLSIISMLIAIKRADDGLLTGFLSFFGWTAMFASRVIIFSVSLAVLGVWFIAGAFVHVLAFSIWVYQIAYDSHVEKQPQSDSNGQDQVVVSGRPVRDPIKMFIMVLLFFGLPSLVMWPIMFQLKQFKRPLKFLLVMTIENVGLLGLWFLLKGRSGETDRYIWMTVLIGTLVGDLFIAGYFLLKPDSDEVVLHDMRSKGIQESFGVFFDFCETVFNLKVPEDLDHRLQILRTDYA